MSECRALTNISGNGVAMRGRFGWEGELDRDKLQPISTVRSIRTDIETAVTTG